MLPLPIFHLPNLQTNTNQVNEPPRTNPILTRSQSGIVKPIERLSLYTSSLSSIPKSLFIALKDPNWCNAMYDEYNALVKNGTWILFPRSSDVNLVRSMWLFKHKFHADGTLSCYKARLVANGSNQQHGVEFDETFSPVVKLTTIRTVLILAVSRQWPIHQLDVKNAFLNDDLSNSYATQAGFSPSRCDSSLFIYTQGSQIVDSLHKMFDMTDLGAVNYFLGISTVHHPTRLFLYQKKYARQLLKRAHMVNCNPSRTPIVTDSKLGPDGVLYASATTSLVGYMNADWVGFPLTCSAEAEYWGVANVVAKTAWIRNLLRELHSPLLTATLVYCDNVSEIYMSANPIQHQRTKHIEIDIHFVRDMVKAGHVRVLHVPSHFQYANIFTKGLPSSLFEDFCSSLSVQPPPAPTAGAY
ncbi:ribonuclease H-like domain-containing protein [Tanacetum coccineum]